MCANVNIPMDFDVTTAIAVLERTPSVLRAMFSGLGTDWIGANEGAETWTPYDNIGHLIHGERTDWIPRAQIILTQGENRCFTPFDRFAQFHESNGKSLAELLDELSSLRVDNLTTLAGRLIGCKYKVGYRLSVVS